MQGTAIDRALSDSNFKKIDTRKSLLRKVNQHVDFSFVNKLTEDLFSANRGRPSISPELYVRIKLLGHFYNIHSNRSLIDHIKYNIVIDGFVDYR